MKVTKINKAVDETANKFNKGTDEDDAEELREVAPDEPTNKEKLLEWGQECIAEEKKKKSYQENSQWRV